MPPSPAPSIKPVDIINKDGRLLTYRHRTIASKVLKSENRGQQGIYTLVSGLQAGKGENVFFEFLILWH